MSIYRHTLKQDHYKTLMNNPIILISAGRSGSTFLCKLLMMDNRITCIQEVWSYRNNRKELLSDKKVNGTQIWDMLNQRMDSELYQLLSNNLIPTADFIHGRDDTILLRSTLPRLFSDPFLALNYIEDYCLSLPSMSKKEAITSLFNYIAKLLNKAIAIEKTGGSLLYFDELTNIFNDSKIIFLVRDGRNVALSKSIHPGMIYGHIKREELNGADALEIAKRASRSKYSDDWLFPIQLSMTRRWSEAVTHALNILENIPSQKYIIVKYERLISQPVQTLRSIIDFIYPDLVLTTVNFENLHNTIKASDTNYLRLSNYKSTKLTESAITGLQVLNYPTL